MDLNELKLKADQYKAKLESLVAQRQEVDRQLIILDEQYKQYKEKITQAFGTSEPSELEKIANQYLVDIENLESQLK